MDGNVRERRERDRLTARRGACEEQVIAWTEGALRDCLTTWSRVGRRYARRLAALDRLGDPPGTVLTLAARRAVPLRRATRLRVAGARGGGPARGRAAQRPLPQPGLVPVARAFNGLVRADRYALIRLDMLGPGRGTRGEHLASALGRLVAAARKSDRPPP